MRTTRHLVANAAYHVCARINRQEMILEDIQFKLLFLDILKEAKKKYKFRLRNFCIMGNHVHLDIEPLGRASLSKIMQWILSVFAIRYNKIFNYKGHVWYDRFKSKVIQTFQQFVNTFFYIANNPVRANLVKHPLHFKFNGITYLKNNHDSDLLDPPEKQLLTIIDEFLLSYNQQKARNIIKDISFRFKKK